MKVAYVDHSYHMKTSSTRFIPDLLISRGHTVDFFWDEAWHGGRAIKISDVLSYDALIMFQICCYLEGHHFFSQLHPNVTYIPMLDQFSVWQGPQCNLTDFWKPFQGCKVISFSAAIHGMATGFGILSKQFRVYHKPSPCFQEKAGLHGFLWTRRGNEVSWEAVKKLIANSRFDSFHLHAASDPGFPKSVLPDQDDIEKYNITISRWYEDKADFEKVLDRANVYFAPRMEEGIGQSFLEAFARGQCVVAPNNGTMNEYILNGYNGYLYDIENAEPLDFSQVGKVGQRAFETCKTGYASWIKSTDALVDFIFMPNNVAYQNNFDYFIEPALELESNLKAEIQKKIREKLRSVPIARKIYHICKNFRG